MYEIIILVFIPLFFLGLLCIGVNSLNKENPKLFKKPFLFIQKNFRLYFRLAGYLFLLPLLFFVSIALISEWQCKSSATHSACDGYLGLVVGVPGALLLFCLGVILVPKFEKLRAKSWVLIFLVSLLASIVSVFGINLLMKS